MTRGADFCGIADKVCEHRFNMSTNACIECRTMLLLAAIEELGRKKKNDW